MKHIFLILSVFIMAAVSFSTPSIAEGDAVKGQKVFKKCKACHTVNKGGKNRVGPNLFAVAGAKAAEKEGYKYSKAMVKSGLIWDDATLDSYLKKPRALLKRTKMIFVGLKKEKDRADVIAYLKTLQ